MEAYDSMLTIKMEDREVVLNLKNYDEVYFQEIVTESDHGDDYAEVEKTESIKVADLEYVFSRDLSKIKKEALKEADKKVMDYYKRNVKPLDKENRNLRSENIKLKEQVKLLKELIKK